MEEEKEEVTIKCSSDFMEIIIDFQKRFEEAYSVRPSTREITKIIAKKINSVGGLKV